MEFLEWLQRNDGALTFAVILVFGLIGFAITKDKKKRMTGWIDFPKNFPPMPGQHPAETASNARFCVHCKHSLLKAEGKQILCVHPKNGLHPATGTVNRINVFIERKLPRDQPEYGCGQQGHWHEPKGRA